MNPYLVLKISPEANDQEIRRAYLAAIKKAAPDTDPQFFQTIQEAYEKIKDPSSRNRHLLFNRDTHGDSPIEAVRAYARLVGPGQPLSFDSMKNFLRSCSKTR